MRLRKMSLSLLAFCFFALSLVIPFSSKLIASANYYCDNNYLNTGGKVERTSYTVNFDRVEESYFLLNQCTPIYSNVTTTNSCACIAGLMIIGYYDKDLPNLIPDFEPGFEYDGEYTFYDNSFTTIALEEKLYELMGTDTIAPGTSVSQFKKGMTSYVNGQGYNITYNSCGSTFNINTAKTYIEKQQPIAIFVNGYEYYPEDSIAINSKSIEYYGKKSTNGHVAVVLGYHEYKYYTKNTLTGTDKFLVVAFGDDSLGFLRINSLSSIDQSLAINIY